MNVAELLDSLVSWPTLLAAFVVYGFAPGFFLRLIVLAYKRDNPRRDELIAELYVVPRIERPFWVLQQLETALFEGLWQRIVWAVTDRTVYRWKLGSGVKYNRKHPDTFWIPDAEQRASVESGVVVKLMFQQSDGWTERMWVEVYEVKRRHLIGRLVNEPLAFPRLGNGSTIKFRRDHIIDIDWEPVLTEYADRERKMFPHCSSSPILTVAQAAGIDWLDDDKKRNKPEECTGCA